MVPPVARILILAFDCAEAVSTNAIAMTRQNRYLVVFIFVCFGWFIFFDLHLRWLKFISSGFSSSPATPPRILEPPPGVTDRFSDKYLRQGWRARRARPS